MEGEGIKGFLPLKEGEGKDREGARGKRREKEGQGREVTEEPRGRILLQAMVAPAVCFY